MIIDSPIAYDLTLGADSRIPEEGDAQVHVPASVLPVVLFLRPTVLLNNPANPLLARSVLFHLFIARVNQAAVGTSLVQLVRGLWEIEISMASSFDYTPAPPIGNAAGVEVRLINSIVSTTALTRFPQIGSFTDYTRYRVLFQETTTISLQVPLTGLTDDLAVQVSVNAIRIL